MQGSTTAPKNMRSGRRSSGVGRPMAVTGFKPYPFCRLFIFLGTTLHVLHFFYHFLLHFRLSWARLFRPGRPSDPRRFVPMLLGVCLRHNSAKPRMLENNTAKMIFITLTFSFEPRI
jgi:hypothetical protein